MAVQLATFEASSDSMITVQCPHNVRDNDAYSQVAPPL
jgi:hypothetical protein